LANKCPTCHSDNPDTLKFCGECGTQLPSPKDHPSVVTEILQTLACELTTGFIYAGRYQIIGELGEGGMGKVFKAQDARLDRAVALKFLNESIQANQTARERLIREAKFAAALDHPFICKIYDADEIDGRAFIAMEFVEGENLNIRMERKPLSLKEIFQIILETAEALEEAHNKGIVHRDLKPSNIMVTPQGHTKVMDFGIAKRVFPRDEVVTKTITKNTLTQEGSIIGTLAYMSPEQARGDSVDSRSDIFSLGVILYELLTGKNPFSRMNTVETLSAILKDQPSPINIRPRKLNPVLEGILNKCLDKDPQKRYQSIAEFCSEIKNAQSEELGKAFPIFRRRPTLLLVAASIVIVLFSVLWLSKIINSGKTKKAIEPIQVLVADFQNKTGDQVFEDALEQAFCIGLEGAPYISIFKRGEAKKISEKLDPNAAGILNENISQLIARREGIDIVVAGLLTVIKQGYEIKIWALDPIKSRKLMDGSRSIRKKEQVFSAIDDLSEKLRSSLGENIEDSTQQRLVETFTTKSLEAMKAYAHAQEFQARGDFSKSIDEYKVSIKEDRDFGRAYSGVAASMMNSGKWEEANEYYENALSRLDRMNDREKLRTRGAYYIYKGNYSKAVEEFKMLTEQFPADHAAQINLAVAYYLTGDTKSAIQQTQLVLKMNPKDAMAYRNLCEYACKSGDFNLAEESGKKALEINPNYEDRRLYLFIASAQMGKGEPERAEETIQGLQKNRPDDKLAKSLAETYLPQIALYESRLNSAKELLEKKVDSDQAKKFPQYRISIQTQIAEILMRQGNNSLAGSTLDRICPELVKGDNPSLLYYAADIYLKARLISKAASLAKKIDQPRVYKKRQDEASAKASAKIIEGEIYLVEGHKLEAENELGKAIELLNEAKGLEDRWDIRYDLGYAYLKKGDFAEAHSEYELCLKRDYEAIAGGIWESIPLVYYYLGQVQEGLKSPAAKDSYEVFLKMKKRSDGDIFVEDARKRLAGLKGS
jgi:serine/threonine protein kinase/Flp pilus assembly protein TadD